MIDDCFAASTNAANDVNDTISEEVFVNTFCVSFVNITFLNTASRSPKRLTVDKLSGNTWRTERRRLGERNCSERCVNN